MFNLPNRAQRAHFCRIGLGISNHDAASDADNDGASALQEFLRDTDPTKSDLAQQFLDFESPSFLVTGQSTSIALIYNTSDDNPSVDRLAFQLFYQSDALGGDLLEDMQVFAESALASGEEVFADVDDLDDNPATDVYRYFEWSDGEGVRIGFCIYYLLYCLLKF